MSYCRWSSDDFQCDIYCYESCSGGWDIHVAANRTILKEGDLPPYVPFSQENIDAWIARQMRVMEWVDTAERREIGLPHDGQSFNEQSAGDAANRLIMLRAVGYNVPQYAIDDLLEEAQEEVAA
jgi:hypothetical protein